MKKNTGTDTIYFIFYEDKAKDRNTTYVISVCDIKTHKTETHRRKY